MLWDSHLRGEDERWGMLTDVLTRCCLATVVPHSRPSALKLTLIWINSRASICDVFPVNPWTFPSAIFGLFLSIQSPVSHHVSSLSLYRRGDGNRTLNLNPHRSEWQTYMDDSVFEGKKHSDRIQSNNVLTNVERRIRRRACYTKLHLPSFSDWGDIDLLRVAQQAKRSGEMCKYHWT